jgi:ABC-2 type transport system ATP-binding protein
MGATRASVAAVRATDLVKRWSNGTVVGPLTFEAPAGVVGFLGPNGSGKTTTLRMLLGLVRPTSGSLSVLGSDLVNLGEVLPAVGAVVEGPALYAHLSGRANLRVHATLVGLDHGAVDDALERVGLAERADHRVSTYSLGMRQRLALALALLARPRLLVLDEPTNGLDPQAVTHLRQLLRQLAGEGTTVLLSSHQLVEVEQLCDHVVLLHRGRVVHDGGLSALLAAQPSPTRLLTASDGEALALRAHLARLGVVADVDGCWLEVRAGCGYDAAQLNTIAVQAGYAVHGLVRTSATLEDAFLALTTSPDAPARSPGEPSRPELVPVAPSGAVQ